MNQLAQELLQDSEIKEELGKTLRSKHKELSRLQEKYKHLSLYDIERTTVFDEATIQRLFQKTEVEEQIMRLERDIRNIDFSLQMSDGTYKEGDYEILFEQAKQLNMQHVYELITGEQVRRGNVCCVFHKERTPSMKLYEDSFHCFGCGAHGDVIDFVQKKNNCTHKEALEYLSKI